MVPPLMRRDQVWGGSEGDVLLGRSRVGAWESEGELGPQAHTRHRQKTITSSLSF